jgi:guanosine-3',5'-bis(diphosphate) 3'-pyrophosphohydrolase
MRTFDGWSSWPEAREALCEQLSPDALDRLGDVYAFAAERHAGQTRPGGQPYVEHLLQVVDVLVNGLHETDPNLLSAALLHDVVEDTPTTSGEVEQRFGPDVRELVDWVTQQPVGEDRAESRQAYLDHLADASPRVLTLKLADRLSNVQKLDTHPRPEKQATYYAETVAHIVPLAAQVPWFAEWFDQWKQRYAHLRS